jgi:hypothetical protein
LRGGPAFDKAQAMEDPPLLFVTSVIFAAFVFQKSIWALNFMKRACNTLFGRSHVSVVGTKVWLYVRTAAEFVML